MVRYHNQLEALAATVAHFTHQWLARQESFDRSDDAVVPKGLISVRIDFAGHSLFAHSAAQELQRYLQDGNRCK